MAVRLVGMSPPRFHFPRSHQHDVWEIVLNMVGSGHSEMGDGRYRFSEGTVFCIPPHIQHNKLSDGGFHDVYIQTDRFPLAGNADENGIVLFQDDTENSLQNLLLLAYRTFYRKDNNYRRLIEALWDSITQLLISWADSVPAEDDVEQFKNKVIHSFADPELSLSALLSEGPYCMDHMRTRFKQATGQTPSEYLAALRIDYAKRLFRENRSLQYNVAEIGEMAGYYDRHYFSRVFKKHEGITPSEYQSKIIAHGRRSEPTENPAQI